MLERLSDSECDAVLERSGHPLDVLAELARSNMLLFATDSRHPTGITVCSRRCSEPSFADSSLTAKPSFIVERPSGKQIAGTSMARSETRSQSVDARLAGEMLWANHWSYVAYGHNATVQRWLDRFSHDEIAKHPALTVVAASSQLASGDRNLAEHWTSAAARGLDNATPADSLPSLEAAVTILRAGIAADGITRMGDDAAHAYDLLADHAPARSICCLLAGAARHLSGDRGTARAYLEEGVRRGAVAAPNIQGLCLAQLALLAVEGDDWASAEALATHARARASRFGLSTTRRPHSSSRYRRRRVPATDESMERRSTPDGRAT